MSVHVTVITHDELRSLATLIHAASRDDVTPIITGVHFESLVNGFTAASTDRYRVAELTASYTSENGRPRISREPTLRDNETLGEFSAIIPAALIARVAKGLPRRSILPPTIATVHVVYDDELRAIAFRDSIHGIELSDRALIGNYPPVARLFPNPDDMHAAEGAIPLKPAFLATLNKLRLPNFEREAAWNMHTDAELANGLGKPKPVLFVIERDEYRMRYLVQPNLRLR